MTTTITINSETSPIIEILQLTPPAIVDVVQPIPPRVNVIGLPGSQGPQGPPGPGSTTKQVILPIPGGYGPTVNPAVQERVISSGSPTANAGAVEYYQNTYDPTVDQEWFWKFTLPGNYDSGGVLRLSWATKGTNVSPVAWKGATCFLVPGTTDADAAVFDTVVTVSDAPSVTEGILTQSVITLTMANAAVNRPVIVMVGRDADNILDTNPNFAVLLEAMFEYVTT
jgi:hypothetical protein